MNKKRTKINNTDAKSKCVGAGLVALDIVMNGDPQKPLKLFSGGSCGNVLTILSFLNWETYPIARLKNNEAALVLISDLQKWKVNTSLISRTSDGSTPIIIQRIRMDKNGNATHKFEFRNPDNGVWLPAYKPVLAKDVEEIISKSPIPSTFYFDRINRAAIELAKYYKKNGSLIYFEPSSMSNNNQFEECLNIADVIKFSNERIKNYKTLFPKQRVPLEIETMGKDGLRYRYSHELSAEKWNEVPSYKVSFVVDSAGAGDWFSAGFISRIALNGIKGYKLKTEVEIVEAMKYGQSLGALNCFFDGARGLMYLLNQNKLEDLVAKTQNNELVPLTLINSRQGIQPLSNFSISDLY